DHVFDVMQRMSDDPVSVCEVCGAPVQRVFHPVAVHFKGKGFYNTDYGTKKRQRELKEAGESSSSKDGASSDKSSSSSDSGSSESKSSSSDSGGSDSKKSDAPAKKAEKAA
ncbi:MAG TPA: FmdB family zinc ribbon protein, partial [Solirubrobacteraceae bacterium]